MVWIKLESIHKEIIGRSVLFFLSVQYFITLIIWRGVISLAYVLESINMSTLIIYLTNSISNNWTDYTWINEFD